MFRCLQDVAAATFFFTLLHYLHIITAIDATRCCFRDSADADTAFQLIRRRCRHFRCEFAICRCIAMPVYAAAMPLTFFRAIRCRVALRIF